MDNSSLAHTMWTCKYHIVFAPKYRRKIIYKKIREDIIHIFKELCKRKGIERMAGTQYYCYYSKHLYSSGLQLKNCFRKRNIGYF